MSPAATPTETPPPPWEASPCLPTLPVMKSSLISNVNLPWHNLRLLALVPPLVTCRAIPKARADPRTPPGLALSAEQRWCLCQDGIMVLAQRHPWDPSRDGGKAPLRSPGHSPAHRRAQSEGLRAAACSQALGIPEAADAQPLWELLCFSKAHPEPLKLHLVAAIPSTGHGSFLF